MKFCRYCGAKLARPQASFCSRCGRKLTAERIPSVKVSSVNIPDQVIFPPAYQPGNDTSKSDYENEPPAPGSIPPIEQEEQKQPVVNFQAPETYFRKYTSSSENLSSDQLQSEDETSQVGESHELLARRYRLLKRIGDGHMSEVWQAEDIHHKNKIVAVKLLNTRHKDTIKQEMYLRETKALEKLEHPNIVKHLEYGWSDERQCHYIVLEYLPRTLTEEIALHRDIQDQNWCWPLMRDITDALMHAHSKGIVHRDLKSSNILLSEENIPKLTDFGISLLRFEVRTIGVTLAGFWSEGFASPEQRSGQKITEQSDIYSLGCVFYHILSGKEPAADGLTMEAIHELHLRPLVTAMFERMIDPEAKNRFESTEQLARYLEHTWKFQTYPDIYLFVTNAVAKKLFDEKLTFSIAQDAASEYLDQHFIQDKNDAFPKEVQIKYENDTRILIFTDTIRLICVKDNTLPLLRSVAIDVFVYPPDHEDQKQRTPYYRRRWHFISNPRNFPVEHREQHQKAFDDLVSALVQQKKAEQERWKQRRERKDFTSIWGKILDLQLKMLEKAKSLEYTGWRREGNTITFQLKTTVPDDLGWPDNAPISFLRDGKYMDNFGLFMGASGTTAEVSTSQGGTLEQATSSRRLPKSGRIGLFQIETISSHNRQKRALDMLISGGTVNSRLPEVLQDVSTAEFHPLDEEIAFFQLLGEDQKSAVRQALATQDIFLLQGPPGTGKTTTLAEIILQILKEDPKARILVSSQSNVAVNHVLTQVAKINAGVGILRVGRPDRIGPGAEAWILEQQLSSWRDNALSRTNAVIADLEEKIRTLHTQRQTAHGRLNPEQTQDLGRYKIWLEELAGNIEDLIDCEQRIERLSERLNADIALSEKMAQEMQKDLKEQQNQRSLQREYVEGILEIVRSDLWKIVELDPLQADFATERTYLYQTITNQLSPDPEASVEEHLLTLVRNWQSVFGMGDDFADSLYERVSILAATCLITGVRTLREREFDWAIIDEGGRATATELLVPLVRSRRSIIVGDEKQLPPMVDSELKSEALKSLDLKREDLEKSLFETLVDQGREEELPAVQMLKEQYRMHPAIGELISQVFYDGKLKHATRLADRKHKLPWLDSAIVWYSTTKLPNHSDNRRGSSFSNPTEVSAILALLYRMERSYCEIGEKRAIAIITPYNEHIRLLRERVQPSNHTRWIALNIEIASVDAFQGRDSHIVIYSTVRSNKEREIGFLKDRRRLNVALSRAQQLLIMVGDMGMLSNARLKPGEENPYLKLIQYMYQNPEVCLTENLEQGDLHE